VFQGSLEVAIIIIDGSEKPNRQLGFELQSSHVIENRNKPSLKEENSTTHQGVNLHRNFAFALHPSFSPRVITWLEPATQ